MAEIITIAESGFDEGEQRLERAVAAVIEAGRKASLRHWVPATSGNFSARIDENTIAITRSGTDKGALTRADVLIVDLDAPDPRASAEAPLHYALYRDLPSVNAIFHIHSPAATVLSHALAADSFGSTAGSCRRPLPASARMRPRSTCRCSATTRTPSAWRRWRRSASRQPDRAQLSPGYLIAGHGLYAWGTSPAEAWRHTEALETLLTYQLNQERLRA